MTLTLTVDRVILHTIVHHSSTSTHMPNFIEIEETSQKSRPKKWWHICIYLMIV